MTTQPRAKSPSRRRQSDEAKLQEAANATKDEPEQPLETDKPVPGVFVARVPIPDKPGDEQVQVIPLNGLDILAVESLLRLGLKVHRDKLGIDN